MADLDEMYRQNVAKALAHGPRLRRDYNKWIVARAPGRVLIGGLGAMGVGSMWCEERPEHAEYHGYADAPFSPKRLDDFGTQAPLPKD